MRTTNITLGCFIFLLLSSIVEVYSQICDSTVAYGRCSSNSGCGCFPMVGADDVGVCGFLWRSCSQLVPCGSSQECSNTDHVCVHHRRCSSSPVCYPLSMIKENICPPLLTGIQFNKWKQSATTVAGGNGRGDDLNQLYGANGIFIDKNQNIFIADFWNHRIVQWKLNENQGKIVAGGNGNGSRIDQLYWPQDVIIDEQNNSLIIADWGNSRVIQWLLNQNQQEILIENITCGNLAMDKYGFVYVSDFGKNEVRKWKIGEEKGKEGKLVAGGNGKGNHLNQLNYPTSIFVDDEQSIYVSDRENDRVMKWKKDAQEGILVAGGNGRGNNLNQLSLPMGIVVDGLGRIYIADTWNHRIIRWCKGNGEGEIIVGGNGYGNVSNQLSTPHDLSFDIEGNLYVVDYDNHRVQKFDLISE